MALLGSSIDPSLFSNDYSGFARAGETQGQMYAQMGKDVGGAIQGAAQMNQQNKQMQGQVTAAQKGYESMAKAFPDQAEFFNTQAQGMSNPNLSLAEKIGMLSSGQQIFGNVLQLESAARDRAMLEYKLGGGASGGGASSNPAGVKY
jgi:phage-related tail protein